MYFLYGIAIMWLTKSVAILQTDLLKFDKQSRLRHEKTLFTNAKLKGIEQL